LVVHGAGAAEAAHVTTILTAETSTQEATAAWDNIALCVKDVENRATLEEREALERVSRAKVENAMALASTREDVEGFVQKITLLEDDLVAERQAREVSKREHRGQFEEHTLLQTWGSELCNAIIGPSQVRRNLSEGMRLAPLRHIEMAGELVALQVVVSSIANSVLGRSPGDTFCVEVVGELATEF
jgi:hypothetical protein